MCAGSMSAERVGQGWGHPQGDMYMVAARVAARLGCQSAMVGTGWACHPQGDMHMVAARVVARLGCQNAMVGTGWANSCPGCMDRLRKR